HERGLGGWQVEWETVPEVFLLTSGALSQMRQVMAGLRGGGGRMRANLDATRGLIYAEAVRTALARAIGHAAAHQLVERACRDALATHRHLQEVVLENAEITKHLSAAELKSLFDTQPHVRAAARLVDQALAAAWGNSASSPSV